MLSAEALNAQPINGISLSFILIFFAPLALVVAGFFLYCVFARRSVVPAARFLSVLWLIACVPACLMLLMGHAFNSSGKSTFIVIPLWVASGLVGLWLPVWLRKLFRIEPV